MSQQRKCSQQEQLAAKPSRRIVLPIDRAEYLDIVQDARAFRAWVDANYQQYPELFPDEMTEGYSLHDFRSSRKLPEVCVRRIRLNCNGRVYRIVPGFVLPYMTGYAEKVEKALFLRRFGVPFWGLTYVFGRSDRYWYRVVEHLGRFDLVGTTVKAPDRLPEHLLADEKFTALNGQEVYVATTVGNDVVLGATVTLTMQTDDLEAAYGEFKREAWHLNPDYTPQTVNLDGWRQTKEAWLRLFPTLIVIRCFLHAFLRIRDRCKNYAIYPRLRFLFWRIYHAQSYVTYWRRFRAFLVFADQNLSGEAWKAVRKFAHKRAELFVGWRHPGCHRVSTMLERHMQPMTRCLYMGRGFHGHRVSAHLLIRSWALLHNFQPYCQRTRLRSGSPFTSPFHKLNGMCYRTCWLENLLIASSGQVEYYHQIR
jgi:hypothetical protein